MRNVLFLCTGNSARSIMAEAYMNAASRGRWRAFSAGSNRAGTPNPLALETLSEHGVDAGAPRSKSWDEFAGADAPVMDAVITVCDNTAGKPCPLWLRNNGAAPAQSHWSFPDPAAETGDLKQQSAAFDSVFADIRRRIDEFLGAGAL